VGEIEVSHRFGAATPEQERTWIGTGDLGYADQLGRIYLVGRAKEILLLPTGRATPGAIEEHLLECGFVRDCGIVALDSTGEFDRLGACIVVEHPDKLDEVRAMLASFQPPLAKVRFVPAIPRTALGKPLRQRLWHLLTAPDDGPTGPATGPRNGCGCFPAGGGPR
jgi:acyl-coenzyme A synthetase/AMP-(fatty) acid ligase